MAKKNEEKVEEKETKEEQKSEVLEENTKEEIKTKNENIEKYRNFLKKEHPDIMGSRTMDTVFKTGIKLFDNMIGGVPIGSIIAISSPPGLGKTTLMVQIAGTLSKKNSSVIYLDSERSMSTRRMEQLGLNLDNVIYVQPDNLEDTYLLILNILKKRIEEDDTETPMVICWDSTASTISKQELADEDDTDKTPAVKARIHSRSLPKVLSYLSKANASLFLINQQRTNIKIGFGSQFGPDTIVVGGMALTYYPFIDIRLKDGSKKEGEKFDIPGQMVKVKAKKNRLKSPLREFPMFLSYEKGFNNEYSMFYLLDSVTKADWKKMGFDTPPIYNKGGWQYFQYKDIDEKFRTKQFDELYNSNEKVKEYTNELTDMVCELLL